MKQLALIICLLFTVSAPAAPLTEQDLPPTLAPWVGWTLHDKDQRACPVFYNQNQRVCLWQTSLALMLDDKQGAFQQEVQVFKKTMVQIPGDSVSWPQNVKVNGVEQVVADKGGVPLLKLEAGLYKIEGQFFWSVLPQSIAAASESAQLSLSVNQQPLRNPLIDENGRIWLKTRLKSDQAVDEQDRVNAQVFRKIVDGNPLEIISRIELSVAGKTRDIEFAHAFLPGFLPLRINSTLPVRLNQDNSITIKLKPGQWVIEAVGRHHGPVNEIALPTIDNNWPPEEIWSFQADNSLRTVKLVGVPTIDPSQTNLPRAWHNLPAFLLQSGKTVKFSELFRGNLQQLHNKLTLKRDLWLDFAGNGFTMKDQINGVIQRAGRLETTGEIELGQANINDTPQMITKITTRPGIEVRTQRLNLTASSRYNGGFAAIPVNGWSEEFSQVHTNLHLPPGWKLLATWGADNNPTSWLAKWNLLDLFLFLLCVVAIYKLWNWRWALMAFVTLGLIWHEVDAPIFIWLNLLVGVTLLRVLPSSLFRKFMMTYFVLSFVGALFITLPFVVQQVRNALYPQLETGLQGYNYATADMQKEVYALEMAAPSYKKSMGDMYSKRKASPRERKLNKKYSSNINKNLAVQTGPGIPDWHWQSINFDWNRTVADKDRLNLLLLPPWLNLILNLLRVALVGGLLWLFFTELRAKGREFLPQALVLLLFMLVFTPADKAVASDIPTNAMLDELATKLLQPPECLPTCAQISSMSIGTDANVLTIKMQSHTLVHSAIPLPVNAGRWQPELISVNGVKAQALKRDDAAVLWLSLPPGIHDIILRGSLIGINDLQLPLTLPVKQISTDVVDWQVSGINRYGSSNVINLSRQRQAQTVAAEEGADFKSILPEFFRVRRELEIGLEWYVNTTVTKLSERANPNIINIPLLDGESVISKDITIKDNQVVVSLPAGQDSFSWRSRLPIAESVTLKANDNHNFVEQWQTDISALRSYTSSGIKPVTNTKHNSLTLAPSWQPWPGEEVVLAIKKPVAVNGKTLTISKSTLQIKPDNFTSNMALDFALLSSKGTRLTLGFADEAKLKSAWVNSKVQVAKIEDNKLVLPLNPGKQQVKIEWSEPQANSLFYTTSHINLGHDSVNNTLKLNLPTNRWVLFTGGPTMGPAVLFWGQLVVVLIFALILGRVKITPLRSWHWFLLGVGLSMATTFVIFIVVLWLLVLGGRYKISDDFTGWRFNLMQVMIFLLSLSALAYIGFAVYSGLLGTPDMQVIGNNSSAYNLNWFSDRIAPVTPTAWVVSVPMFVYRILMLLWALWLAFSLLNWLKWGWSGFSQDKLWSKTGWLDRKN